MSEDNYLNFVGFQCLEHLNHNSMDLYLSTCGIQNCFGGHFFGPGKRDVYILHFISEGKGVFTCGEQTWQLGKGDVFLVKPDTEVYYAADEKNPWSYLWVGFHGLKAASYLSYAGFEGDVLVGKCRDTSLIFTYIQQMIMNRQLTYANELKRQSALLQIFASIIEEYRATLSKDRRYDYPYKIYVEQAVKYIQGNFRKNVRIQDIAMDIGIDRSYLSGIFKEVMKMSPQEYLLHYRVEQAEILLKETDRKVSDIAELVGYADAMTFSKMFKKYKGMSPQQYREEQCR